MYCTNCGAEIEGGQNFCPKCGSSIGGLQPGVGGPRTQDPGQKTAKLDVDSIVKGKPRVLTLKEEHDFASITDELDKGLKTWAFKGLLSRPAPSQVKVLELTKVYEPIHMVKALYEGVFDVEKEFVLNLDPGTTKLTLGSQSYDVKAEKTKKGLFVSASPPLGVKGVERVEVKNEKSLYLDMDGKEMPDIEQYVKGKELKPFSPSSAEKGKVEVLDSKFDVKKLEDKLMKPDLVKKPQKFKRLIEDRITLDLGTVYYPKFLVKCRHLAKNQEKTFAVSAVDGTVLPGAKF